MSHQLLARYGNFADMFKKLLKDGDDEVWDTHVVFERDSPPDLVLAQYEVNMQPFFVGKSCLPEP